MIPRRARALATRIPLIVTVGLVAGTAQPAGQTGPQVKAQKIDEEYTRLIKLHTQDARISTELVDHMPASDTVPSPLKFFGRIPGTPDELTYYKDVVRYLEALDKASDRVTMWKE